MSVVIYLSCWSIVLVHLIDHYRDHGGPCSGPFYGLWSGPPHVTCALI